MPDSDLYVGLAGVAVVFAGFSGISVVLTGRQPGQWRQFDAGRLLLMISLSFAAAFFSLLPLVVARLLTSTESLWQLCSAPFLVFTVAGMIQSYVLTRRAYRAPDADRDSARNFILFFAGWFLAVLALSANTLRVVPALSEGFYLVALVCYLGLAALMFFRTLTVLRGAGGE